MEELTTQFLTYHHSANDLHLRTDDGIVYIAKGSPELQETAKKLRRGQRIRVSGERVMSKTLSTMVLQASAIEHVQ